MRIVDVFITSCCASQPGVLNAGRSIRARFITAKKGIVKKRVGSQLRDLLSQEVFWVVSGISEKHETHSRTGLLTHADEKGQGSLF